MHFNEISNVFPFSLKKLVIPFLFIYLFNTIIFAM